MKKYLLPLLFLLLLNPVLAVTVRCGTPQAPGDYLFANTDPVTVRVFINTAGTSISASPNNFDIPAGGNQLVQLRAPTNTYAKLFVTYTDATNGFSASLECPFYATTGSSSWTTTTTVQQGSCSSYSDSASCRAAGCTWISVGLSGYCTGSSGSTTTTLPLQTTTTTVATTTTLPLQTTTTITSSSCNGRSFTSCGLLSNCEWVGSYATGYCREKVSSTTTTIEETTTTTIVSTPSSGGSSSGGSSGSSSSGSSGGSSSGGSSGSSSGGSGKSTGFYDFPNFVQVPANGEKTITGNFYAARDLSDVKFQVADVDGNWFTITPSSVQTIKSGETVNLTIKIQVPENAKQDSYVFRLVAKTNVNYEKKMTLAVTEKVATTTTTTFVVTTTTVEKQTSTGFFVKATQLALDYWYLIAVPVVIILTLAALPMTSKKSKGSAYMVVEDEQDYRQDFVEVKIKEPEQPKTVEEKPKRDINEAIRKKVIKEIRERAMKDKRS